MKKKAGELKKADKVKIAGKKGVVDEIEISDLGKQGTKKVRMVVKLENGEKVVIVRPEDYPIDTD